jgi:streptogramin lyase
MTFATRTSILLASLIAIGGCAAPVTAPSIPISGSTTESSLTTKLKFKVWIAGRTDGFRASAIASDIAPDSLGNLWFTDYGTPAIGRIAADGTVTEFTKGLVTGAFPIAIVPGRGGTMWFSDFSNVAIGKITQTGAITEYAAPHYYQTLTIGVAFGVRGPWLSTYGGSPLLAHLTRGKKLAIHLLPPNLTPGPALAFDANGNLWLDALTKRSHGQIIELQAHSHKLARIDMHLHYASVPCCPNQAPRTMIIGPDGNPWFTTLYYAHKSSPAQFLGTVKNGKVGLERISQRGLGHAAFASGIASDANGIWLSGSDPFAADGALWRIDSNGHQVAYDVPYSPLGLTVDSAGHPWFTSFFSGRASQIVELLSY